MTMRRMILRMTMRRSLKMKKKRKIVLTQKTYKNNFV
jgi:hypothetical protein